VNLRAAAAIVICQVIEGASLTDALPRMLPQFSSVRDQAFLQAVCYGVCRWYFRLDAILNKLFAKPLKAKDRDIHGLLLIGLYQLIEMRVPQHAALAETVSAAIHFKKKWAKEFINAVLRNYQRSADEINQAIQTESVAFYAHPAWLIERLMHDWPNDWQAILIANNQHPPFALRVNRQKNSREGYLQKLTVQHIAAYPISETGAGIMLAQPIHVQQLPGFTRGEISVQDGAAQLAAELVMPLLGDRILDACAAPGGKTAHLLELHPDMELIAIDRDAKRLQRVYENLERLQLSATLICADAGDPETWWDGKQFDRILLDAPCSASGVIRRHPDIKLLRQAGDVVNLVNEQRRLLTALWPLLKPGGFMVYVTCSVFPEENTCLVESFMRTNRDAKEEKIQCSWGKECVVGRQILPGMHSMDGFYFACLRKC